MLDNFGLGEFFMLALLALLFFGPERLPQMGAKLGQWIGKLTSYSRSFMTEWREEALAIQEAVAEVRGIRDELMAAQREISGSLQTARNDVAESIDLAKEAVTDARSQVASNLQNQRQSAARDLEAMAREEAAQKKRDQSESAAIDKTQQILAALQHKQEAPSQETLAAPDATEAPDTPLLSPEEDEWERNRRAIQEIMNRNKDLPPSSYQGPPARGVIQPTASAPTPKPAADESKPVVKAPAEVTAAAEEVIEKEPRESAFDRTQKILDSLNKRRSGEAPAQEEEAPPAAPAQGPAPATKARETAFDRSQQILADLKKRKSAAATPAEGAVEPVPDPAVDRQAWEQLQAQVTSLHDEIAALRREMEAIRSATRSAADELAVEEAV